MLSMNKKEMHGTFWTIGLFAIALLGAPAAHGDIGNFMDDPARDLTRLNFYPHSGNIYLAPDFQYAPTELSNPSTNGSPLNDTVTHSMQADLLLTYGLPWEGFRVGVAESWLIHRWADTTYTGTGAVSQTTTAGLSNPTFSANVRVKDAVGMGFGWDLGLSFSPSWVGHDVATTTTQGTDGTGYGIMSANSIFYYIDTHNDFGFALNLTQDFSGSGVNQSNSNNSYTRDSVSFFGATLTDRWHFTQDLYGQLAAAFAFGYSVGQTNAAATPVTTTFAYPFRLVPSALVGYRVAENFTLDLNYSYQNYNYSGTPTSGNDTTTQYIESNLQLRARFQF